MKLDEGLAALGIALPDTTVNRLSVYLALLAKWNRTYNLTAVRNPDEMVTHHLLDCLAVLPILQNSALAGRHYHLADVGSGAGLPGLVLALACPEWSVVSVEAVEKKAAFQRQVKIELAMTNVEIHGGRVETYAGAFAAVISRAFSSLADYVRTAGHLSDCLWAMKGVYPADEIAALPSGWRVSAVHELRVPGLAAERCLLQLGRA
jgi:16S rRNA (guanine527-N7)-methyltransferase